jgi:hypothetical protein
MVIYIRDSKKGNLRAKNMKEKIGIVLANNRILLYEIKNNNEIKREYRNF